VTTLRLKHLLTLNRSAPTPAVRTTPVSSTGGCSPCRAQARRSGPTLARQDERSGR
jgi:hypothetical protein